MAKYNTKGTESNEVSEKQENSEKKKVFGQDEGIMCRSSVQGGLYLTGFKSRIPYEWTGYGDRTEVEYRDLVALVRERSGYIFNPFFIIEDDDFIEEFPQLKKFYTENYTIKDLSDILALDTPTMVNQIKILPKTAMESLKKIAANQVSLGQIDSISKVKALDEIFGTDLNLISEIIQQ